MPIIKNKTVCDFTCKAEKLVEKTILRKIFDTKNTLKDRIYMYIFLFTSVVLWMWIVWANAYQETQLVKNNIISVQNTHFVKLAIEK